MFSNRDQGSELNCSAEPAAPAHLVYHDAEQQHKDTVVSSKMMMECETEEHTITVVREEAQRNSVCPSRHASRAVCQVDGLGAVGRHKDVLLTQSQPGNGCTSTGRHKQSEPRSCHCPWSRLWYVDMAWQYSVTSRMCLHHAVSPCIYSALSRQC